MPEHVHEDHAMLLLPLINTMTVSDRETEIDRPLEPHFFYFVDAGVPHKTKSNRAHQEHLAVYLNSDWQRHALKHTSVKTELKNHAGIWRLTETASDLTRIVIREAQSAIQNQDISSRFEQIVELLAEDCLMQIQSTAPASMRHPSEHGSVVVLEVLEYLRRNLSEPLSLDDLAVRLGISRRHLTRLFRHHTGRSVGQYFREERFHRAKCLLEETDWSIQQIAADVGIESAANFASGFKRQFGVSPSSFRNQS